MSGTENDKTVAGCFYKLSSQYTTCPAQKDTTIKATPKTYPLGGVTYCQLSCESESDCGTEGVKCAAPGKTQKGDKLYLEQAIVKFC